MKKLLICMIALTFVLAGMIGMSSAAQNVANDTQKGSLLIFPKIDVSDHKDTIVRICNDYSAAVHVTCFWVNSILQNLGFDFTLYGNQCTWFSAKYGNSERRQFDIPVFPIAFGPGHPGIPATGFADSFTGELKCFTSNADTGRPISFNHLFGTAEIMFGTDDNILMYGYPSWNFTARGVARGTGVGVNGELKLNGQAGFFDACPAYLTTEYLPPVMGLVQGTEIALVPCIQDMRQDGTGVSTKAKFDIWDMNGTKMGTAWKCVNTLFDGFLAPAGYFGSGFTPGTDPWTGLPIGAYGGSFFVLNNFSYAPNCSSGFCCNDNGRIRVTAVASSQCESPYFYNFWRDLTIDQSYLNLPSPIPGLAVYYYMLLGVGPVGSTKNTSFVGTIIKYGVASGCGDGEDCHIGISPYAKNLAGAGCDATGNIKYDEASNVILEFAK